MWVGMALCCSVLSDCSLSAGFVADATTGTAADVVPVGADGSYLDAAAARYD